MKGLPLVSRATPSGWFKEAAAAGPPSPLKVNPPLPATVVMMPVEASTRRMRPFCESAMKRLPFVSRAIFAGRIKTGAEAATAVAAITSAVITPGPAASKRGNNPCGGIHSADLIVELVDEEDVFVTDYGDPVGKIVDAHVQRGFFCRFTIAIESLHTAAGRHTYLAGRVHYKYSISPRSSDVDVSGGVGRHCRWHWNVRRKSWDAVGTSPGVGMDDVVVNPGC